MGDSERILGPSSGALDAKVMFVGEAPGRLGADSTGIPFHGDKAGDNFESLLDFVGISREDIFVTNAVLCNPRDSMGNNATPNSAELGNCSGFLKQQIDLVDPAIVVTLGANALKATSLIERHALALGQAVRTSVGWYGRRLIPLYHPGQRAMLHRSMANQRSDYQFVAERLKRIGVKPRRIGGRTDGLLADVVRTILAVNGRTSYFALHKLAYLLEVAYVSEFGKRLTGAYFIRQKDGPYCTGLHINKLKNALHDLQISRQGGELHLALPSAGLFADGQGVSMIGKDGGSFIERKMQELKGMSNGQLKTKAYRTKPMRQLLKMERKGLNLYNAPLDLG